MVKCNPALETGRKDESASRLALDGIYFTRFDTYETENDLMFRSRMPDAKLVQVETRLQNGELVIQGKVRLARDAASVRGHPKPLCFYRSFPISREVFADQVSDNFKDGVLTVRLPKA
jgi:HSP20 family molecular chaperone IbpA